MFLKMHVRAMTSVCRIRLRAYATRGNVRWWHVGVRACVRACRAYTRRVIGWLGTQALDCRNVLRPMILGLAAGVRMLFESLQAVRLLDWSFVQSLLGRQKVLSLGRCTPYEGLSGTSQNFWVNSCEVAITINGWAKLHWMLSWVPA
jgi:hypothetical protein